jgi:hypothetical protein
MDLPLYLLVDEPDPRLARVVSLTDLSRLPLPIFTYGDRLAVSVYLVTRAGGYHADSTAERTRTLTLGFRGQTALVESSAFSSITNGFGCTIDLSTTALALALRSTRAGQLVLAHKTTNATGPVPTTRCSLDCSILGDVPPA